MSAYKYVTYRVFLYLFLLLFIFQSIVDIVLSRSERARSCGYRRDLGLCHVFSTFNYVFWNAFDLYLFCIHIFLFTDLSLRHY